MLIVSRRHSLTFWTLLLIGLFFLFGFAVLTAIIHESARRDPVRRER